MKYQQRYLEYWNSTAKITKNGRPVDFVLLPALQGASYRPGEGLYGGYSIVINLLDFTAAVFPVTKVDKEIDKKIDRQDFLGELDRVIHEQCQYISKLIHMWSS